MTQTTRNLITRKQAADRAGVHTRTIDYWRRTRVLTTYKTRGNAVRIDLDELEEHLAARVPAE